MLNLWFLKFKILIFLLLKYRKKKNKITISKISNSKEILRIINYKIEYFGKKNRRKIQLKKYENYFNFYENLKLRTDFEIISTVGNIKIKGTRILPILENKNNDKAMIFCHGVTRDRWSLFYIIHLTLQRGYQVITYDARNHGFSDVCETTLGQVESCDLQDIIIHIKKNFLIKKIGLYGFSMGASTCLFWLSYFSGPANHEVSFAICESPFDIFFTQKIYSLGKGYDINLRSFFLNKFINEQLNSSEEKFDKINPLFVLPHSLPIKLLILHGISDSVISSKSSLRIYEKITKNPFNKKKINIYFCKYSDHGDLPFISDFIPNSLKWKTHKKNSKYNFTSLFFNYLERNL